jgi:hypothetical protein
VEHRIETGDAKPIRKSPYKVPYALRKEMETQVNDMLEKGIIELSSSPWGAPAILVPKRFPDERPKYRFCADFRALKAVAHFDAYQLPVFDETMSTLHGSKYFTTLDCLSGFWQINIAERDKNENRFLHPIWPISIPTFTFRNK